MLLLASLLVESFFFPDVASAEISAPGCSLTWEWSFNSLGQNACEVAAFMMSTCNAGSFTVDPLQPGGWYPGPSGTDGSNLCKCSTVGYSLISACAGCQGEHWISWSEHVTNCTKILPPSSFPNPIPSGTFVPQWALLDVTNENFWNANESSVVGDFPEVGPGWILGPSGPSVSVTTSSGPTSAFGAPSSTTTTPAFIGRHRSDGGAIIGGVIGGIVTISIVVVAVLYFYRRRRRLMMPSPMFEGNIALDPHIHQFLQSTSSQGTVSPCSPETPTSPLRPYYLDYPAMYSEFQVTSPPPAYISGQVPTLSPNGSQCTVDIVPSSQVQGYHGSSASRFHR